MGRATSGAWPAMPLVDRYRSCSSEELASGYAELGGAIRALEAQRLAMLAGLDERDAWRVDGARHTAGWVATVDAVHRVNARAVVTVARALVDLPAIAAVTADGGLSFDQLRPLSATATPVTDDHWAVHGPGCDPGQLAAHAARTERVTRERAQEQEAKRTLSIWRARGGGSRLAGYLPDVDAAVLAAGLDRLAERYQPAPDEEWEPLALRRSASTRTTSGSGRMAAPPTRTTSSSCADATTRRSTRAAGRSPATRTIPWGCASSAPPVVSSPPDRRPAATGCEPGSSPTRRHHPTPQAGHAPRPITTPAAPTTRRPPGATTSTLSAPDSARKPSGTWPTTDHEADHRTSSCRRRHHVGRRLSLWRPVSG